jgi:AcrR family transcriptional regulator
VDTDKRECILKAAVRAFSRLGFRKTSIDEVAQEAGVGKGTIYLAVSSKDELFLQAVERELAAFLAEGRKLLPVFDDAVELLSGLVASEVADAARRPLVRGLFVGQTLATVPASEAQVDLLVTHARDNLVHALERLRDGAALRDDLEVDVAARLVQDLEIAALVRAERRSDATLTELDWRRPLATLVRGLRRPLVAVPATRPTPRLRSRTA